MLTPITGIEFAGSDATHRIIEHDHPRRFASLVLPRAARPLFLSWRSDLVEPSVRTDARGESVWVGVDQRLACVALDERTLFSIGLDTPLLEINAVAADVTIALCGTQAVTINRDYSLRSVIGFPDRVESVAVQPGKLIVSLLGGESKTCQL